MLGVWECTCFNGPHGSVPLGVAKVLHVVGGRYGTAGGSTAVTDGRGRGEGAWGGGEEREERERGGEKGRRVYIRFWVYVRERDLLQIQ